MSEEDLVILTSDNVKEMLPMVPITKWRKIIRMAEYLTLGNPLTIEMM